MANRKTLPDAYVIFICDFDPFDKKKYRYTFDSLCREDHDLLLEDGSHTVFLSTCGENEEEVPPELVTFLKYVKAGLEESTEDFADSFVRRVQDAVKNVKASREMEEQYMLLEELIKEEREEARQQGLDEGRKLGLDEGRRLGLDEGRGRGIVEGRISDILDFLLNFGEVPEDIRKTVEEETEVLRSCLRQASKAKSMDEFRQFLAARKEK